MARGTLKERFWVKVDKNGPTMSHMATCCWVWLGALDSHGYGSILVGSRSDGTRKAERAHRLAWSFLHDDQDLTGKLILHECDNPPCVRHVFLGTHLRNTQDMYERNRHPRKGAHPGEAHAGVKLTLGMVRKIRSEAALGRTYVSLSREFHIGESQVSRIVRNLRWKGRN